MIKLFVGGFPLDTNELSLAKMLGLYGDISTVKIVRDKKTGFCKGYAFIDMADRSGAQAAADALDGTTLAGKVISVKINEEQPEPASATKPAFQTGPAPAYKKVEKSSGEQKKKRPRKTV